MQNRLNLFETNVWVHIEDNNDATMSVYKPHGECHLIASSSRTEKDHDFSGWGRKYKVNDYKAWWEGVIKTPLKLCSIYDPHITDWDL